MSWKIFALLESSCSVLLSVLAIILMGFVLTSNGPSLTIRTICWLGIVAALALTLVAHAQLIGSFRRRPGGVVPQAGSIAIPILVAVVLALSAAILLLAGSGGGWASFAQAFLVYALVPPAVAAFASRLLVLWSLRRLPSIAKM